MQQTLLPLLTTERLLLRQLQHTDDKAIFALRSNEQVNEFIQRSLIKNINDACDFITAINEGIENKEWLYWAMILQNTQQLVGTICLWHFSPDNTVAETGYELHPHFQGTGLMNEALQKIIDYGFNTLHLKSIEAYTQPDNAKSVKLLEKNYFIKDQTNNNTIVKREIRFVLTKPTLIHL